VILRSMEGKDMVPKHVSDYGDFCVWPYQGPSKKARGFWHGDSPTDQTMWAFALKAPLLGHWETSQAKGGFTDELAAVRSARQALARR
jgi:hypothetical protein